MEKSHTTDTDLSMPARRTRGDAKLGLPRDFRVLLQEELLQRCRKNRRYSLRSFAASLDVGSSDLSKLIHRRRGVSEGMLLRLGKKLALEPEVIDFYRRSLTTNRKRGALRVTGQQPADAFQQLARDAFHVVSDWYPLALLELSKVRGFIPDHGLLARTLDITVSEVTLAVERLQRLGFLTIDTDGNWHDRAGSTTGVSQEYTDLAKKKYQKQILEKAIEAVEKIPFAARDQSSMLMAVDTRRLPEARELIKDFRRRLCALLEESDMKDQVMFLSVSLFPVADTNALLSKDSLS